MNTVIEVENLCKIFSVRKSSSGPLKILKNLFCPKKFSVKAVENVSFKISKGERLAFIGPNGAGKSTTIKVLTGILFPTSGKVEVLGMIPWKKRKTLGFEIGTVFGQRTQLWYHLPPSDTFDLLSKIYELSKTEYQKRLKELVDAFEISPFLNTPVRKLSLGQRMRCEIVASLLHSPQILFLDEPTIGLDVHAKLKIRAVLNKMSKDHGTTLFLTSHDTADIEQICERVIILNDGKIIRDGRLDEIKREFATSKRVALTTETKDFSVDLPGLKILKKEDYILSCELDLSITPIEKLIHEALKKTTIKDITIEDPSMDEIIRKLYAHS